MIIDVHPHVGASIHGQRQSPSDLLRGMDRLAIDRAVVCPMQPLDYHLEGANDEVAAAVREHPDRFTGFCRVDPRRGAAAVDELDRAVSDLGLVGLFLHPWEEGYPVNGPQVDPVMDAATYLGVPVMIASGYPWRSHALQVAAVAHRHARLAIIMTHGGQLNISGLAQQDAMTALVECPNLVIEVSGVYRQDFIEDVVSNLGAERVLFGSNVPEMDQEFELERIRSLKVADGERAAILGENARALLSLPLP